MIDIILIAFLSGLVAIQVVLNIPLACRFIIEVMTELDLWYHGLKWEFDWDYVLHGSKN